MSFSILFQHVFPLNISWNAAFLSFLVVLCARVSILYVLVSNCHLYRGVSLVELVLSKGKSILLKDTSQCLHWGSNVRLLDLKSSTLPLSSSRLLVIIGLHARKLLWRFCNSIQIHWGSLELTPSLLWWSSIGMGGFWKFRQRGPGNFVFIPEETLKSCDFPGGGGPVTLPPNSGSIHWLQARIMPRMLHISECHPLFITITVCYIVSVRVNLYVSIWNYMCFLYMYYMQWTVHTWQFNMGKSPFHWTIRNFGQNDRNRSRNGKSTVEAPRL